MVNTPLEGFLFFLRKQLTCWDLCEGKRAPTSTSTHLPTSVPSVFPPVHRDGLFCSYLPEIRSHPSSPAPDTHLGISPHPCVSFPSARPSPSAYRHLSISLNSSQIPLPLALLPTAALSKQFLILTVSTSSQTHFCPLPLLFHSTCSC